MVLSLNFSVSVLKTTITLVSTNSLTFSIILELKCYSYHWLPISFVLSPYVMMLNSVLFIFLVIALLSFSFLLCQSLTSEIHFVSFWWLTGFSCLQSITQMDCIDISPYPIVLISDTITETLDYSRHAFPQIILLPTGWSPKNPGIKFWI